MHGCKIELEVSDREVRGIKGGDVILVEDVARKGGTEQTLFRIRCVGRFL